MIKSDKSIYYSTWNAVVVGTAREKGEEWGYIPSQWPAHEQVAVLVALVVVVVVLP